MDTLDLKSDGFAYTMLIDRLSQEGKFDQGNVLLGLMMKKGIDPDEVTFTALIDGYCKNGRIENAVMLLDTIRSANVTLTGPHAFNSLIDAFSKEMKPSQGNAMLAKMLRCGVTPSVVTYTILINGFCRTLTIERSLEIFELMKTNCNCPPNVYTFTVLIDGFCQNGRLEEVVKLIKTMRDSGVTPNVITYTILVRAYVKSGNLEHAFKILNDMVKVKCQPNFETFSALLEGIVPHGYTVFKETDATHIVEFLQNAKKHGVEDSDVYSFLIVGLYKVGRILEGDELVQEMVKNGYFPNIFVCSQIVELFCKQGKYDHCVVWIKLMFGHGFC